MIATREGHDDRGENFHHARSLLEKYNDIRGISNVGGSSDGIGRALLDSGRAADVSFIGHGLTTDTRALLARGVMDAVISQSPDLLFRTAVDAALGKPVLPVPMDIYFSENLPLP